MKYEQGLITSEVHHEHTEETTPKHLQYIWKREGDYLNTMMMDYGFTWTLPLFPYTDGFLFGRLGNEIVEYIYDRRKRSYRHVVFHTGRFSPFHVQYRRMQRVQDLTLGRIKYLPDEPKADWVRFLTNNIVWDKSDRSIRLQKMIIANV